MNEHISESERHEKSSPPRIKSRVNLLLVGMSFMMNVSAYQGVLAIESSINIEEGLGTMSVMVIFITSTISCVTIVPFLIDFYGPKTAIIIGEIGTAIYIASNFYPNWYTVIFASVLHGLTESAPWIGTSVYVTYLGEQRWIKKKTEKFPGAPKPKDYYIFRFFGGFYTLVYLGDLLGFGLIASVLMAFKGTEKQLTYGNDTVENVSSSYDHSSTSTNEIIRNQKLAKCGARDCQAEYIYNSTEAELESYNPNPTGTYVLLGIFITIALTAIVVQLIFLARAPAKFDKISSDEDVVSLIDKDTAATTKSTKFVQEIKDLLKHLISPMNLLLVPLFFHYGLLYGYYVTEYTRAFVSCTVGVEKLGIALALLSASAVVTSTACAKIVPCVGIAGFLIVIGIIHCTGYLLALFWLPNLHNLWVAYAFGIFYGVCEGTIVSLYQGLIALYFEKKLGIAYSVQNLVTNIGIVACTGWSTHLCGYNKVYVQLGTLAFAMITVGLAELKFRAMKRLDEERLKTRVSVSS